MNVKEKEYPETIEALRRLYLRDRITQEKPTENVRERQERGSEENIRLDQTTDSICRPNVETGKRPPRSGNSLRPGRRSRSNNTLGKGRKNSTSSRSISKGSRNTLNSLYLKHTNLLKQTREDFIGVTRRTGYQKPLQMTTPIIMPAGEDAIRIVGSEMLQFVEVETSAFGQPTTAGDVLDFVPLNPLLLSGTRMAQHAALYQKYKYNNITFEFVPSVPSLQDGSLIMLCIYDPDENYSVITEDPLELMRLALAHEGANLFNVYDYGRTVMLPGPNALKSYFIKEGQDSRQEMQAVFLIVAGSSFTNETTPLTLGSIVMHYDMTLMTRDIIDPISNMTYGTWSWDVATTQWSTMFQSAGAGLPLAIKGGEFLTAQPDATLMYILRFKEDFTSNGSALNVYDETNELMTFGAKGSVWFARASGSETTSLTYLYSTFQHALENNVDTGTIKISNAQTITWLVTGGYAKVTGYPLSPS